MAHEGGMSSGDPQQLQAFTERLRAASRHVHSTSDALVNAKLLVAFTRVERYGLALSYFQPVFEAIEAHCQAQSSVQALAPLAALLPRISRTAAFAADLEYLIGPSWRKKCKPPPATVDYVRYLDTIAHDRPQLLLAHLYTQHSALLAGGQMIRRMARKAMQLQEGHGTSVFEFPDEESPTRLRNLWKQTVNDTAARLPSDQQAELVQEHCKVFGFNNAIVGSFRVSPFDWPLAVFRTAQILPVRLQILLCVLLLFGAWCATWLWALLRSP